MTPDGYRNRLAAIEWHANLWALYGTPLARCEAMMRHVSECLDADFYGEPRPETADPEILRMVRYLDAEFGRTTVLVPYD